MDRPILLAVLLVSATLAGCTDPMDRTVQIDESFEEGLGGWARDADVPDDPNRPGRKVNWSIDPTTNRSRTGDASARLFLDGRQDDGTIWLERTVEVPPDARYRINVTAHAWSRSESFNTIAHLVMVGGLVDPEAEGDFPPPGESRVQGKEGVVAGGLREPLDQRAGWRPYSFEWVTPELATGTLHVAVGITAVWETEMTYDVDDVRILVVPA